MTHKLDEFLAIYAQLIEAGIKTHQAADLTRWLLKQQWHEDRQAAKEELLQTVGGN